MSWSGYRPSDDPQVYGYNVPVNMYAASALERALAMNERVWRSAGLGARAAELAADIRQGIDAWGVVQTEDGDSIYAYEVNLHKDSWALQMFTTYYTDLHVCSNEDLTNGPFGITVCLIITQWGET